MATPREWANGYLQQARADLRAAEALAGAEPSVTLMLLQMTLEKLAKAALLRASWASLATVVSSHQGAVRLFRALTNRRDLCRRLGFSQQAIKGRILPFVDQLERLQPSLAGRGPNLEYPWETPHGEVHWPAQHLDAAHSIRPETNDWRMLVALLRNLRDRFDQLFP